MGFLNQVTSTKKLFEDCMYTSSAPDILIRTSGETRLSDFLLWQSSFSLLQFLQVLWPDFSLWHIFFTVLQFQRNYDLLQEQKQLYKNDLDKFQDQQNNILGQSFLKSKQDRTGTFLVAKEKQHQIALENIVNSIYIQ